MKSKGLRLAGLATAALVVAGVMTACSTSSSDKSPSSVVSDAQFVWHDLVTSDPVAARRFYGGLLGWEFEDSKAFDEPYLLAKLGDRYVGGIVGLRPGGTGESQWLSYLTVGDVDAALKQLEAAGGRRVISPTDVSVGRVVVATDPQGAPVGLATVTESLDDFVRGSKNGAFAWMDYFATDPQAAANFYGQLAGFEVSQHGSAKVPYLLLKSDQIRAGVLRNPVQGVTPNWLPYVNVGDLAGTLQRAAALGGRVIIPPSPLIRNGNVAVIQDPTGGVLALQTNPG